MPDIEFDSLEWAFLEALALIALACLFVPLSKRLGLGSIIGYLAAGVAANVALSLSYAEHPEELLHFAEFGVVLFLFVIGLEFQPKRLWEMRGTIFGRGLTQVAACGFVLAVPVYLYMSDWRAALIAGMGLALSSTALVMQEIDEARERRTTYGQTAIAVLLFEDLAIVPLLLLVALLGTGPADAGGGDAVGSVLLAIGAIGILILAGRYGLDPMFRILARTRTPEIMTASALGVVIAASGLMAAADMSYAMGAFIAGVMLASSSYRHEVEADIEPFRALFLGLFFIAVGLSLEIGAVIDNWPVILIGLPLLVVLKSVTIYAVSRIFGSSHAIAVRLALGMSQHGEFGFVLFAAAGGAGIFDPETSTILVSIVTLSMALSSQSGRLVSIFLPPRRETMDEDYSDADGNVLVIGFGRFGQLLTQVLLADGRSLTVLDDNADRIREARRFGTRVHFGDGRRREVLRAAGAETAELIVIAVNDPDAATEILKMVKREYPEVPVVIRAWDRIHAIRLLDEGADEVVRETAASAMEAGAKALRLLGADDGRADDALNTMRERDKSRLAEQRTAIAGAQDRQAAIEAIVPERIEKQRKV